MKKCFLFTSLFLICSIAFAQYSGYEKDILTCNNIKAIIYPKATQFYNSSSDYNSYFYPANSDLSTLFTQALWVGGISEGDSLYLAAERYTQEGHDFWSGPYTNPSNHVVAYEYYNTWKVTKEQILYHTENYTNPFYEMPEDIETWPAHGDTELGMAENLAEFVDVNRNGIYDPENGDYPLIKGDESVFYIINDNQEHTESGGEIMGVEIQCLAWAYESHTQGEAYDHTIFLSYKVINRSNRTYFDTYIGVFADFDIGYAHDDYIGCNVENGYFFAYNGDNFDNHYQDSIPVQASVILSGPFLDEDNLDNPSGECDESINGSGFGDGIEDNERIGLNRFVYFNNSGNSATNDPDNASDYYNYMCGIWKDGTSIYFGGNGHISSGVYGPETRFVFPGDSDPCNWGTNGETPIHDDSWTEEEYADSPGDRRGLASMGPFTFKKGGTQYIDLALVTGPYNDELSSLELLDEYVSQIKQDYLMNPIDFGNQYVGLYDVEKKELELKVYPNPVSDDIINIDIYGNASYSIHSLSGQKLTQGSVNNQEINISHLHKGIYFIKVSTKNKVYTTRIIRI